MVGNVNEYGLCIGESTFGGLELLSKQTGAIVDYGSLIWITLQRAKTAREAISIMVELMDEYGYASEGESFSIADHSGEVWIMEVIGRGNTGRLGAVWVARRIPDGYITSHANQARNTTFPQDDPENCLYADDVVDLAIQTGLFPADADENDFSFSDVYAPVSFGTARLSEARVWSIFSRIADEDGSFEMEYLDYATGRNIAQRMPLWIKPYKKLSLLDLMTVMSNHYELSELDASTDVGAGFNGNPYRPRPLIWNYNDKTYHNERTVATQQTGWNFIAQMRHWMPQEMSHLFGSQLMTARCRLGFQSTAVALVSVRRMPEREAKTVLLNQSSSLISTKLFGFKTWWPTSSIPDFQKYIPLYNAKSISYKKILSKKWPRSIRKHLNYTRGTDLVKQ